MQSSNTKYLGDTVNGTKLVKLKNGTVISKNVTIVLQKKSQPLINMVNAFYDIPKCDRNTKNMPGIFERLLNHSNSIKINKPQLVSNPLQQPKMGFFHKVPVIKTNNKTTLKNKQK